MKPIDGDLYGYVGGNSTCTFHTPPSYGPVVAAHAHAATRKDQKQTSSDDRLSRTSVRDKARKRETNETERKKKLPTAYCKFLASEKTIPHTHHITTTSVYNIQAPRTEHDKRATDHTCLSDPWTWLWILSQSRPPLQRCSRSSWDASSRTAQFVVSHKHRAFMQQTYTHRVREMHEAVVGYVEISQFTSRRLVDEFGVDTERICLFQWVSRQQESIIESSRSIKRENKNSKLVCLWTLKYKTRNYPL